jgi:signal transduction histidine kinase
MELSLRARVILGAILWTTGLFAIAGLLLNFAIYRHPGMPIVFHATFRHGTSVFLFAIVCMVYGLMQVRRGLSPMHRLRARLAAVREGREPRLDGRYPAEVQPLVDDLNALIADREQRVTRAMAKAGDLAHGLKTPLAILANEARLIRGGAPDAAATIDQQVDRMLRQVDYHLAHARAAASSTASAARTPVHEAIDGLVRALTRLYAAIGAGLTIDNAVDASHAFRGERQDLEEMLGNLLDNACKWARSRIRVTSSLDEGVLLIDVDDDGPGIEAAMREAMLRRGVRADESAPGSGLGLAIARDLAELYGGGITLGDAPLGGLRARLRLPSVE